MAFVQGGVGLERAQQRQRSRSMCDVRMAATADTNRRQHVFSTTFYQNLNAMSALIESRKTGPKVEPSPHWARPARVVRPRNEVSPYKAAFSMEAAEAMTTKDEISPAVLAWAKKQTKVSVKAARKPIDFVPSPVRLPVVAQSSGAPAATTEVAEVEAPMSAPTMKPTVIEIAVPAKVPSAAKVVVPDSRSSPSGGVSAVVAPVVSKPRTRPQALSSTVAAITSTVASVASPRQDPDWSQMTAPVTGQAVALKRTRSPIEHMTRYVMRTIFGAAPAPSSS
eukprot:CAMPEP_0185845940 /NCGR_PEP_ID=MMETSP1354-20130828/1764_1 /TAXON_ID=708628 /ORGANISM="Erythrolobus madagascarensis, Strain CCMP3276" /LENGTH=279 /DNA_ID=CAMNT_0028546017 /DNA_START=148 /DNA_END=987 /DNA_ORIENTATION=+